ncbi:hypothetical protein IAR50_007229 [Cryptococcus sp. DSM 104548]
MITDNSNSPELDGFEVVPQNTDNASADDATLNVSIDVQDGGASANDIVEQTEKLSIATPEPTAEKDEAPRSRGHGRHHHSPRSHLRPPPGFAEDGETRPRRHGFGGRHHKVHGHHTSFESDGEKVPPIEQGDNDRADRPRRHHGRHHFHPRGDMPPPPPSFYPFDFVGFPHEFFGRGERSGRHHHRHERGEGREESGLECGSGHESHRGHKHHHRAYYPGASAEELKTDSGSERRHRRHHRAHSPSAEKFNANSSSERRHHHRREHRECGKGESGVEYGFDSASQRGHKHRHPRAHFHTPSAVADAGVEELKAESGSERRHYRRGPNHRGPHFGPDHHRRHHKSDNEEATKIVSDTTNSTSESESDSSGSDKHCCCSHRRRGGRHSRGFGHGSPGMPPHVRGIGMYGPPPPPPHMFYQDFKHAGGRGPFPHPHFPPHMSFADKHEHGRFGHHSDSMGGSEHRRHRHGHSFGGRGDRSDAEYRSFKDSRPRAHGPGHGRRHGCKDQGSDDEYAPRGMRGMPSPGFFGFEYAPGIGGPGGRGHGHKHRGMLPPPGFGSDFGRGMGGGMRGPFFGPMGHMGQMGMPPRGPPHHHRRASPPQWMGDLSDSDYDGYPSPPPHLRPHSRRHRAPHPHPHGYQEFYAGGPAFVVRA